MEFNYNLSLILENIDLKSVECFLLEKEGEIQKIEFENGNYELLYTFEFSKKNKEVDFGGFYKNHFNENHNYVVGFIEAPNELIKNEVIELAQQISLKLKIKSYVMIDSNKGGELIFFEAR